MSKKYGVLTSSQNPEEIANKVKGVVLALSSIIIFLAAKFFNIGLTYNDMVSFATELGAVSGLIWGAYGSILHLISWFYSVKAQQN